VTAPSPASRPASDASPLPLRGLDPRIHVLSRRCGRHGPAGHAGQRPAGAAVRGRGRDELGGAGEIISLTPRPRSIWLAGGRGRLLGVELVFLGIIQQTHVDRINRSRSAKCSSRSNEYDGAHGGDRRQAPKDLHGLGSVTQTSSQKCLPHAVSGTAKRDIAHEPGSKINARSAWSRKPRELAKGALAARPNSFLVYGMPAVHDTQSHFRGLQSHVKKRYLKPEILRLCNERTIFVRR
jgi:hypothetical protein